jgi:hypothetical protein
MEKIEDNENPEGKKNKDVSLKINGNKLTTGSEAQIIESVTGKLPEEALKIIIIMKNINEISERVDNSNINVSFTSKGLDLEGLPNDITLDELRLTQDQAEVNKNVEPEDSGYLNSEKIINEEQGSFTGIVIGSTNRRKVIDLMGSYSKYNFEYFDKSRSFFYPDISVLITFDNEGIVDELTFEQGYTGETTRGLSIGDTIEKAVSLYGQPYMRSSRGAIWNKFAVFSRENYITSIRLQGKSVLGEKL